MLSSLPISAAAFWISCILLFYMLSTAQASLYISVIDSNNHTSQYQYATATTLLSARTFQLTGQLTWGQFASGVQCQIAALVLAKTIPTTHLPAKPLASNLTHSSEQTVADTLHQPDNATTIEANVIGQQLTADTQPTLLHLLVGVRMTEAEAAGCSTVSMIAHAVQTFGRQTDHTVDGMVVFVISGGLGPVDGRFRPMHFSDLGGEPSLATALVYRTDAVDALHVLDSYTVSSISIDSTPGLWNEIFTSAAFQIFHWLLLAANALLMLSCWVCAAVAVSGGLVRWQHFSLLVATGMLAQMVFTVSIAFPLTSMACMLLGMCSTLLYTLTTGSMLIMWRHLQLSLYHGNSVHGLFSAALLACVLAAGVQVFGLVFWCLPSHSSLHLWIYVEAIMAGNLWLLALISGSIGILFWRKRNIFPNHPMITQSLSKMSTIIAYAAAASGVEGLAHTLLAVQLSTTPVGVSLVLLADLCQGIAGTLWSWAVLALLLERFPASFLKTWRPAGRISRAARTYLKRWRRATHSAVACQHDMHQLSTAITLAGRLDAAKTATAATPSPPQLGHCCCQHARPATSAAAGPAQPGCVNMPYVLPALPDKVVQAIRHAEPSNSSMDPPSVIASSQMLSFTEHSLPKQLPYHHRLLHSSRSGSFGSLMRGLPFRSNGSGSSSNHSSGTATSRILVYTPSPARTAHSGRSALIGGSATRAQMSARASRATLRSKPSQTHPLHLNRVHK